MKPIVFVLLCVLCCSCGITRKTKTQTHKQTETETKTHADSAHITHADSIGIHQKDSSRIVKTDSTGTTKTEETNEHTIETVIDTNIYLEGSKTRLYVPMGNDTVTFDTPDKTIKVEPVPGGKGYYLDITDKPKKLHIKANQKETVKNTLNKTEQSKKNVTDSTGVKVADSSHTSNADSSHKTVTNNTHTHATDDSNTKNKFNISLIPWWLWLILLIAAVIIFLWRKGYIKKAYDVFREFRSGI